MAEPTINYLLDKIKNEPYGKNMRSYIIQAIQKCYEDGSAGAEDLVARASIATLVSLIGTSDVSIISSEATDITKAVLEVYKMFQIRQTDPITTLRYGMHDWLPGFFDYNSSTGLSHISFQIPLPFVVSTEDFPNTENSNSGVSVAWHSTSTSTFRTVGVNGWRETAVSNIDIANAEVRITYNRTFLWVVIPVLVSILQPHCTPCMISSDMVFSFNGF